MAKKTDRKKVNFMIDKNLLIRFFSIVPSRQRSDFLNEALEGWMIQRGRELASKAIDDFRIKHKWKMTDEEVRNAINYGRE